MGRSPRVARRWGTERSGILSVCGPCSTARPGPLARTRWASENQFVTDEAIGNKQRGLKLLEFFCGRSLGVVVEECEPGLVR